MVDQSDGLSVMIDRGQDLWEMTDAEAKVFADGMMRQPVLANRKENAGVPPHEALAIMIRVATGDLDATKGVEDVFPQR